MNGLHDGALPRPAAASGRGLFGTIAMKTTIAALTLAAVLGVGLAAQAYPHQRLHHRVCSWQHHHRVCRWR